MSKSKKSNKKPQASRRTSTRAQQQQEQDPPVSALPRTIWNIPRLLLLLLIRLYQETLAKGVPANTCRFHPTCSHYGYQAIYKYGVLKGGWLATWRVLRCNPFNRGGYDPVP
jgi:putative membrane protein insertion efficiency factor